MASTPARLVGALLDRDQHVRIGTAVRQHGDGKHIPVDRSLEPQGGTRHRPFELDGRQIDDASCRLDPDTTRLGMTPGRPSREAPRLDDKMDHAAVAGLEQQIERCRAKRPARARVDHDGACGRQRTGQARGQNHLPHGRAGRIRIEGGLDVAPGGCLMPEAAQGLSPQQEIMRFGVGDAAAAVRNQESAETIAAPQARAAQERQGLGVAPAVEQGRDILLPGDAVPEAPPLHLFVPG